MFGQVRLGDTPPIFNEVFEDERLFHGINDRHGRFFVGRSCFGDCGFNGRYEELALVQTRNAGPEGQIEEVRESFGPAEPAFLATLSGGFFFFPSWSTPETRAHGTKNV